MIAVSKVSRKSTKKTVDHAVSCLLTMLCQGKGRPDLQHTWHVKDIHHLASSTMVSGRSSLGLASDTECDGQARGRFPRRDYQDLIRWGVDAPPALCASDMQKLRRRHRKLCAPAQSLGNLLERVVHP